jgi:isopenicillin-N epimerase
MRQHFLLDPGIVFLNHGSFGACPREVLEALQRWQLEMERNPVQFLGRRSAALLRATREHLAEYLGARADDLVFVTNSTTGVNIVARSLALQPGDEILTTDLEYGACLATWGFVAGKAGARLRAVKIPLPLDTGSFADRILAAVTPRTRLLFVSHVGSTTALVLPIADLLARARAMGILTLVDGAHAPGQLELDLDDLGADFYTGNCHKWMCAPKGAAFLHARPEHQAMLHATVTSWGYLAGDGGHTGFDAYTGRTVFERRLQWQGTRDIAPYLSVLAAIHFQQEHDWPAQRARCHAMSIALLHRVAQRTGLAPIGNDEHFAQMVPLQVPHTDAEALRSMLFEQHHIEVPVTQHDGRTFVRVSVQAYNTEAELQTLERALGLP